MIPLPMTPQTCNEQVLTPALALLPSQMDSADARRMLLTIMLQESGLAHRRQMGNGPARGLAQFEQGGGVAGVLRRPISKQHAERICDLRHVVSAPRSVWVALEHDDILAACFARLLLWTDPKPMPTTEQDGFDCYLRTWRPGAYTRGSAPDRAKLRMKWGRNWDEATKVTHA